MTDPTLCETRATAEADPTLKSRLHPRSYVISWAEPPKCPGCAALLPSLSSFPCPSLFFFFFFFPLSRCSLVVFPGRLCLAADPFPRLSAASAGLLGFNRALPSTVLFLAPPKAPGPGARAAGRERCLRRHLREREPGRANGDPSRLSAAANSLWYGEAKLSPCRTGKKCQWEGSLYFPRMRDHRGVG